MFVLLVAELAYSSVDTVARTLEKHALIVSYASAGTRQNDEQILQTVDHCDWSVYWDACCGILIQKPAEVSSTRQAFRCNLKTSRSR